MPLSSLDIDHVRIRRPDWNPAMMAIRLPGIPRVNMRGQHGGCDSTCPSAAGNLPAPENVVQRHHRSAARPGQTRLTHWMRVCAELLESLGGCIDSARSQRKLTADNSLITTGASEAIYLALTQVGAGAAFIFVRIRRSCSIAPMFV